MTNDERDLAKQLAEHPRWRWMPGMEAIAADGSPWRPGIIMCAEHMRPDDVPDLSDGATQGCLIEMLGSRFECLHYRRHTADLGGTLWSVLVLGPSGCRQDRRGYTLGEALARALLAAWGDGA